MITAQVSEYRKRLATYHERILLDHDQIRISSKKGDVVVLPAEDYENLLETIYVLKDKVTMASLLDVRKQVASGSLNTGTVEEAFSDLVEDPDQ